MLYARFVCVSVTLKIAADDESYTYADGEVVLHGLYWNVVHSVDLDDACVLAVFAANDNGDAGILAETSTGVVTDDSWKCSAVEQTGWHLDDFDDAAWAQAWVIGTNDGSHAWAVIEGISAEAKWIWAQDSSTNEAYCRKTLC